MTKSVRNSYFLSIVLLLLTATAVFAATPKKVEEKPFTVVIDAGHGAHDAGAVGKISKEKNLNLAVALKLGKQIEENYPDVRVRYTRTTDVFLTLQQRADFVNKNGADLFICIHTNSAENRTARGAEVWVLGQDDKHMSGNLDVAMRENAVMLLEDNYEATYQGFDPNSVDSYIMFELMQNQYLDHSLQFATLVQDRFVNGLKRVDRGVRQAGFWVLYKSSCPSVLVEMGFISNADEEKYLASEKGKEDMANAIYSAFVDYKTALDKRNGVIRTQPQKPSFDASENTQVQPDTNAPEQPETLAERPVYRVQIFSTTKPLPKNDATFKGLKNCQYTRDGKFYKYTYGEETDYDTIVDIRNELRAKFKDCYIVAFYKGKQISVKEARLIK